MPQQEMACKWEVNFQSFAVDSVAQNTASGLKLAEYKGIHDDVFVIEWQYTTAFEYGLGIGSNQVAPQRRCFQGFFLFEYDIILLYAFGGVVAFVGAYGKIHSAVSFVVHLVLASQCGVAKGVYNSQLLVKGEYSLCVSGRFVQEYCVCVITAFHFEECGTCIAVL